MPTAPGPGTSPALDTLQRRVGAAVLGGSDAELLGLIEPDGMTAQARLQIYRNHARLTLTESLKAIFPVVCQLVDERFFDYAAAEFIRQAPPSQPCLVEYGAGFADFLAAFPPCRDLVYLPDVARLEWAVNAALHAVGPVPVEFRHLQPIAAGDVPHLALRLDPSLRLMASEWPIDRIWQVNQPESPGNREVDLASGGVWLRVHRRGERVVITGLGEAAFRFLHEIAEGCRLQQAEAAASGLDHSFDLAANLRALLDDALIVGWSGSAPVADDRGRG